MNHPLSTFQLSRIHIGAVGLQGKPKPRALTREVQKLNLPSLRACGQFRGLSALKGARVRGSIGALYGYHSLGFHTGARRALSHGILLKRPPMQV